jgi:hypothetical protein
MAASALLRAVHQVAQAGVKATPLSVFAVKPHLMQRQPR